jgi:hypothetical protein
MPFQPTLPPQGFLQQPPMGPRRKASVTQSTPQMANANLPPHPQPQPPLTGQAQHLLQQQQPNSGGPQNPNLAQMYSQTHHQQLAHLAAVQRFPGSPQTMNSHLAQSVPARSSPLAMNQALVRGSPHIAAQTLARNSPHMAPQQLSQQQQQRPMPLANGQAVPPRPPMQAQPTGPPHPPQAGHPQNQAHMMQQNNYNPTLRMNRFLGQNNGGGPQQVPRTGTPNHGQPIPRVQVPQHAPQLQPHQMYYPPVNYAQLPMNYPPNGRGAGGQANRPGMPNQQAQQLFMQNAMNAQMGRGVGAKRVPGR